MARDDRPRLFAFAAVQRNGLLLFFRVARCRKRSASSADDHIRGMGSMQSLKFGVGRGDALLAATLCACAETTVLTHVTVIDGTGAAAACRVPPS